MEIELDIFERFKTWIGKTVTDQVMRAGSILEDGFLSWVPEWLMMSLKVEARLGMSLI